MPKHAPAVERFWVKVDLDGPNGCWPWIAATNGVGYGQFYINRDKTRVYAHRFAYELLVGPIPAGLDLDHLCRNRACVNPEHLEPVTRRENLLRGRNIHREKTHCPRGHPYDEDNTYYPPVNEKGWKRRECRACTAERRRKRTATGAPAEHARRYRARLRLAAQLAAAAGDTREVAAS